MRRRPLLLALVLVVLAGAATMAAALHSPPRDRTDHIASAAAGGHSVTFRNETADRIWVGAMNNTDGSTPMTKLPMLEPGASANVRIPEESGGGHWAGKFFARQGCSVNTADVFHCAVGDCGPSADYCPTGEQPTSLAEFNFDTNKSGKVWYDVSYVNAVSVPITITPDGVTPPENGGDCSPLGCPTDLLSVCPRENLTMFPGSGTAMGSGTGTGTDHPLGVCVNPNRDAQTPYSQALSQKCPTAYTWSKNDAVPGNQVMKTCGTCSSLTVTFHGTSGESGGAGESGGSGQSGGSGDPAHRHVKSGRPTAKGVALNPFEGTAQALSDSGVSWYHNWASSTGEVVKPDGVEYVPTIWGPGSVNAKELGQAAKEGKNLLAFNEPDLPAQADMSPEQALDLWPQLEKTGLRLGAPAVASGAADPGGWLDRFMRGADQRGLRVDFIPVHWYGSYFGPEATAQLADYLKAVHDRYKKPVWLTEYALIDFTHGQPRYPSEQEETRFIQSSTQMLESKEMDFVERYAWFALSTRTSPTGLYDGTAPNAGGRAYREAD